MRSNAPAMLRRLLRYATRLACAVTLLVFLTVMFLAVRGFWVQDLAQVVYRWYPAPDAYRSRWVGVRSLRGSLSFSLVRNDYDLTQPGGIVSNGNEPGWVANFLRRHPQGFGGSYSTFEAANNHMQVSAIRPSYQHDDRKTAARHDEYWRLTVPSLYVLLMLAVLGLVPGLYEWRMWRRRAWFNVACAPIADTTCAKAVSCAPNAGRSARRGQRASRRSRNWALRPDFGPR